jgi:hypothetical protein
MFTDGKGSHKKTQKATSVRLTSSEGIEGRENKLQDRNS